MSIARYDTAWAEHFERERAEIALALGERALRIEHIGSTSVPGLAAKPVIDIEIAVAHFNDCAIDAALCKAGYELAVTEPGHRMYRRPEMHVHLHLWESADDFQRHVAFRDWLRAHPDDRQLYEHVKRKLAEREWSDRNDYAQAKTAVISAILRRANGLKPGPRIDDFARIIRQHVSAPARILEIGAGQGELAHKLSAAGYDVVALDRHLRSTFPVVESSFEAYEERPGSFDCIAAQLVLHHVDNLDATLMKAATLLRAGGILAIDDYGWERSDDAAFRAQRSDLHTAEAMLRALRSHFSELAYFDHAYFDEGAGTDRLGFTFIGRRFD